MNPGLGKDARQRPFAPLVLPWPPQPALALQVVQACGQGLRGVIDPILIKPRTQFLITFETLTTTPDGGDTSAASAAAWS
jgi:hypothetical protein